MDKFRNGGLRIIPREPFERFVILDERQCADLHSRVAIYKTCPCCFLEYEMFSGEYVLVMEGLRVKVCLKCLKDPGVAAKVCKNLKDKGMDLKVLI